MKLHLIGGFLGSGKTTAIGTAAKILIQRGIDAAAILNDQGNMLVDRQFVEQLGIPNGAVTGGCFCCNYHQLSDEVDRLSDQASVVFAESVGSCTDLVATVLKPLLQLRKDSFEQITFSTFADARLFHTWLKGEPLPFGDDTSYIWEKQLEESEVLVINKIDLLSKTELEFLHKEAEEYTSRTFVFQNSLNEHAVRNWLEVLDSLPSRHHMAVSIDYDRYGAGEANLAWLDESIDVNTKDNSAVAVARDLIETIKSALRGEHIAVGHLKFHVKSDTGSTKVSYGSVPEYDSLPVLAIGDCNRLEIVVNARAEISPTRLREVVASSLDAVRARHDVAISESDISAFQPGYPRPAYRLA
jgi:G3E family GTPase